MAMVISLTAFLPGLGPADEGSAQAALSKKAVPVDRALCWKRSGQAIASLQTFFCARR